MGVDNQRCLPIGTPNDGLSFAGFQDRVQLHTDFDQQMLHPVMLLLNGGVSVSNR